MKLVRHHHGAILASLLGLGLCGCAFDVHKLEMHPARLIATPACADAFTLEDDVHFTLGGGYTRTLKRGTRWSCIGRIPQGQVYHSPDQVLTVEASNVFEARLVAHQGRLVGFYLPVERAFSPLGSSPPIPRTHRQ